MTHRTQWIIFAVLICVLAVVALNSLLHKGSSGVAALPAAKTEAPAGEAQAAVKPEVEAPNPTQLAPLSEWFDAKTKPSDMSRETADSFGHQPPKSTATTAGTTGGPVGPTTPSGLPATGEPDVTVPVKEAEPPPTLQGTLWVNGSGMALFEGEAFQSGERIRGTAYTVAAVKAQSVSVKGADGQVITLKLSE